MMIKIDATHLKEVAKKILRRPLTKTELAIAVENIEDGLSDHWVVLAVIKNAICEAVEITRRGE